jgi:hypothetical protein
LVDYLYANFSLIYGDNSKMLSNRSSKVLAFSIVLLLGLCLLFSALPTRSYGTNGGGTSFYGGEAGADWGYSVVLTKDVGLAMAGSTESYGAGGSDMWLIRTVLRTGTHSTGATIAYQGYAWNKTYGGAADEGAKQVIQASDGGFALVGYTNSSGAGGLDMFLVKTGIDGEMVWNATFGGPLDDTANSVVQTSDGGYLLTGYTHVSEDQQASWVVKTDSFGVMQWSQSYPGSCANSVILGLDGSIVLAVDCPGGLGLVKLNPSGELLWNQTYPAVWSRASAQSVVESCEGGFVLVGWTENSDTGTKAGCLVRTDSSGNTLWNTIVDDVRIYSVIEMSNGDYAMCGDYASVVIVDKFGIIQYNRPDDGLSDDMRPKVFTAAYSIIEASPLHFVLAGGQHSYGQMASGYNALLMTYNLVTDTTPPTIKLLSPQNGETYLQDSVPLTFSADSSTVRLWYSIDDQGNNTITGNMTLPTLTEGTHKITVYGQDETYNTGASQQNTFLTQTIYITVATSDVSPPTTQPTQTPTDLGTPDTVTDQTWIVYLVVAVGVVGIALVGLGWYLRKDIPSSADIKAQAQQNNS